MSVIIDIMPILGIIIPIMGMTVYDKKLSSYLFSKTKRGVLALLFGHPDDSFYVNQIVELLGSGSGAVQRELKMMAEAGIVVREKKGNLVYYQANKSFPIYAELKSIVTKTFGMTDVLREALAPLSEQIVIAFVYGSMASGEATAASDIDLMVVGDMDEMALYGALSQTEKLLARSVNYTLMSRLEFHKRRDERGSFLDRVLSGPKIMILGSPDEI